MVGGQSERLACEREHRLRCDREPIVREALRTGRVSFAPRYPGWVGLNMSEAQPNTTLVRSTSPKARAASEHMCSSLGTGIVRPTIPGVGGKSDEHNGI